VIYRFREFSLDTERLELASNGALLSVQPQVFELLRFLVENKDRVVSKDEIFEAVWEGRIVSDGTLNARINAVRRALGDDGQEQTVIRTFPRRGFRFVAELDESAATIEEINEAADEPKLEPTRPKNSIAILPFNNLSGDPEQEYFADGLTEDLITDLSKNTDMFVIARNSSFSFKKSGVNIIEVGAALGVATVLEGSVRKAGNRIRINAQLIDAQSGGHIWAERYDRDMDDIFALQDEITEKIVAALAANLITDQEKSRQTSSVEAYELSLKGRAKFFQFTPETNLQSIQLFEQAIEVDPNFSDAWAGQVFPYQSGWSFLWEGYDDGLIIAKTKAEKAVELDPYSSFGQSQLGWVQSFLREHSGAIASFERSLELDPNNANSLGFFAEVLNFAGNPARAIEMAEEALRYDPMPPPNIYSHLGHAYLLLNDLETAHEFLGRAIQMVPGFPVPKYFMSVTEVELGNLDAANVHVEALLKMYPLTNISIFDTRIPYADDQQRARILAGMKSAGLPEA